MDPVFFQKTDTPPTKRGFGGVLGSVLGPFWPHTEANGEVKRGGKKGSKRGSKRGQKVSKTKLPTVRFCTRGTILILHAKTANSSCSFLVV